MKILFYDTKIYDKESFEAARERYPQVELEYLKADLTPRTAPLAAGYQAVCAFVSSDVGEGDGPRPAEGRCAADSHALRRF